MIIKRSCLCVHTWSVHIQIHLPCCVYAGSSLESHCLEVKDDPNDTTECPRDNKPSSGMFAGSGEQLLFPVYNICFDVATICS